jgi:hypothetical protein
MTTRQRAKIWLRNNFPEEVLNPMRSSKYFSDAGLWFFTFPARFFDDELAGHLNILCETAADRSQFHYLKVPFSFFRENEADFDIRLSGDFDLHISAKDHNWLIDERSNNISFRPYHKI